MKETNRFFDTENSGHQHNQILCVPEHGFIVSIQKHKVTFDVYNENKNYSPPITSYLEYLFSGYTIGIKSSEKYELFKTLENINILYM